MGLDDEVVCESGVGDGAKAAAYVGAQQPVGVGFVLDLMADAHQAVATREFAQCRDGVGDVRGGEVGPAEDAADQVAVVSQGQEFRGLLGDTDGLDEDRADHVGRLRLGGEVGGGEGAGEGCEVLAGDPWLGADRQVPEVVVGVDDPAAGHSCHTTGSPAEQPSSE